MPEAVAEIVLVLVVVLVLERLFRPQDLVLPNAVTGDLTGGRGFTLHKTIEDEDDDEYEDEKEVPRTRVEGNLATYLGDPFSFLYELVKS